MRTNDDRPITMHALAAKTDTEHLPQRVASLLAEHTQQVAQRRERYTEWQHNSTAAPPNATSNGARPNGATPGLSNATIRAWSSNQPAATLTVAAMSREQFEAPIPIDSVANRRRVRRPKASWLPIPRRARVTPARAGRPRARPTSYRSTATEGLGGCRDGGATASPALNGLTPTRGLRRSAIQSAARRLWYAAWLRDVTERACPNCSPAHRRNPHGR